MNQKQFEIVTRSPKVKVSDLKNLSDRTLLYGTWKPILQGTWEQINEVITYHLYMEGEMYHLTIYVTKTNMVHEITEESLRSFKFRDEISSFLPNDLEFNPECSDYEFCVLLKSKGIVLNYKSFDNDRPTKKFYGILFNELKRTKKND